MAVMSFMDASEFDASKAYFNKLKSKEEICFLVLNDYKNQPLNETVKAVVVNNDTEVTEISQGVVYYKQIDYKSDDKELVEFLEELIDPTDIYTYVVKLEENFNDLRVLTELVSKYSDNKLRFVGGNLLALEKTGVGFFSDAFIEKYKLKTKPVVRFNFTQVKLVDSNDLVIRDIDEYQVRKTQAKKSKVVKSKTSSGSAKPKTVNKKRNVMSILDSY